MDRERFQVPACEAAPEFAQDVPGRDRRQCERVDADIAVLAAIELQNVELHDAVDGGDQDLASAQRQRLVRGVKIGIADGVEHDVRAVAGGQLAHPRRHIAR